MEDPPPPQLVCPSKKKLKVKFRSCVEVLDRFDRSLPPIRRRTSGKVFGKKAGKEIGGGGGEKKFIGSIHSGCLESARALFLPPTERLTLIDMEKGGEKSYTPPIF